MTTRIFEPQAELDLAEVLDFLEAQAGPRVALKYANAFQRTFDRIRDFPAGGSPRPEFGPDTRLAIVSPYLIFYDYNSFRDSVWVLRILHSCRNVRPEIIRP